MQKVHANRAQDPEALTEMFPFLLPVLGVLFPHYDDFSFLLEKKSKTGHMSLLPKICFHQENSAGCRVQSGTHCPVPAPQAQGAAEGWGTQAVPVQGGVAEGGGALPQAGTTWSSVS